MTSSISALSAVWQLIGIGYYEKAANDLGESLLSIFNPEIPRLNRVSRDWTFTQFSDVLMITCFYIFFVSISSLLFKPKDAKKEVEKSSPPVTSGRSFTTGWGNAVIAKFWAEPVLVFQTIYNIAQVLLCTYLLTQAVAEFKNKKYLLICNAFDYRRRGMAAVLWIFFMSKIVDFFDTFFIIIRQKWKQLSFLHIYHHITVFLFYWINMNVAYDGDIYFTIILNSFVHLLMYLYYLLRTIDVPVPTAIKKFVTKVQMIQFVAMGCQGLYLLAMGCPFPHVVTATYILYIASLFLLFYRYTVSEYGDRKRGHGKQH